MNVDTKNMLELYRQYTALEKSRYGKVVKRHQTFDELVIALRMCASRDWQMHHLDMGRWSSYTRVAVDLRNVEWDIFAHTLQKNYKAHMPDDYQIWWGFAVSPNRYEQRSGCILYVSDNQRSFDAMFRYKSSHDFARFGSFRTNSLKEIQDFCLQFLKQSVKIGHRNETEICQIYALVGNFVYDSSLRDSTRPIFRELER